MTNYCRCCFYVFQDQLHHTQKTAKHHTFYDTERPFHFHVIVSGILLQDYLVSSKMEVDNQVRNIAPAILHSCQKCPSQFRGPSGLFQHNRTVHLGLSFPCQQCAKVLNTKTNLKIHIRTKHDNQWHECKQCDFKATFKPELLRHIRVKHEEIKLECDLCEKNYSNIKNLRLHKTSVHDCIRHYCKQCEQSFVLKHRYIKP